MKLTTVFSLIAVLCAVTLSAADLSKVVDAKRWEIAECTAKTVGSTLVVNMPVDHKGGQKGYFVGWPRLYLRKFLPAETNWSKAKAISFDLKLEFTGKSTSYPLSFHFFWRDKAGKKNLSKAVLCPALKNNSVNKVTIPFPKEFDAATVFGLGFNISESRYKHGENFKFTVSNFKLVNK